MTGSCLAENFCTQWVAERKRGELGEKAEGSFRMELRGSCPHKEGTPGRWRFSGRRGLAVGCCKAESNLERQG